MSDIFKLSSSNRVARKQQILNLETIRLNQVNFGEKRLRALGPKIWNNLPPHTKSAEILSTFKNLIESRDDVSCNVIHAKPLRSEDLAYWVFFIHTNTTLHLVNRETMGESVLIIFWLDYIIG